MELTSKTIILLSLFATNPVLKDNYGMAADNARRALLMHPDVNKDLKEIEKASLKNIKRYTGLDKEDFVYAAYVMPIVMQNISTKPFPKFKYENDFFILRPELNYNLQNKQFNGMLILIIKGNVK